MKYNLVFFITILFASVLMAAGLAHVFSLPNKIHLSRTDYLLAQQVYKGWSLLGIAVFIGMITTIWQAILWRKQKRVLIPSLIALGCIILSQAIFWLYTYPANQQTSNWSYLPEDWIQMRNKWEYSHLFAAIGYTAAVIFLISAALKSRRIIQ
jgi:hypothetical protein